jgi:site-specific recombinase XerC
MLGHASLLSTQVYTRVAIGNLQAVPAATHPGAPLERKKGENGDGEKG